MSRSKQFIAILEDTVNTAKLQQIWQGLQLQSNGDQMDVQVNEIQEDQNNMLNELLDQDERRDHLKGCVLSIEVVEGKLGQIRKVLSLAECQLLKLVKVPVSFRAFGRKIPSQIMRDQF